MNARRWRFGSDDTSGIVRRAKTRLLKELNRLGNVAPGEARALAWAFLYHFLLLCSYYIIRPIRDEMGVAGGVENLQWLFLGTFAAMMAIVPVFGWLTSRLPRKRFLPYAYLFFIANLLGFFALFRSGVSYAYVARAFFIWVSVFNLFVVSVFWSFMTDIFGDAQSKRLFGFVAAGGSAGAIAGPAIAAVLVQVIGVNWLLPMSAGSLALALLCIRRLVAWESTQQAHEGPTDLSHASRDESPMGGSVWAGLHLVLKSPYLLGICGLILLYTTLSTFLYFQQAHIVRDSFGEATDRTTVFAGMDLAVNALTLLFQVFLTGRIVQTFGLPWALAVIPLFLVVGFGALAYAPVLAVFVVVQVLRRAGNYALMKPAREMLYVVLGREEKYKAKNFIDTAVYRSGDAVSAWVFAGMRGLGLTLAQTALVAVPLAAAWGWVAYRLGKKHDQRVLSGGHANEPRRLSSLSP